MNVSSRPRDHGPPSSREMVGQNFQVRHPISRDALERGVADAITPSVGISDPAVRHRCAVNYHLDMPFYPTTFLRGSMNQGQPTTIMSDNQRPGMDEHCTTEWVQRVATAWADEENLGSPASCSNVRPRRLRKTDEESPSGARAAEPMPERWADASAEAGHDPDKALSDLIWRNLKERDSPY